MNPETPSAHLPWVFRKWAWVLVACVVLGGLVVPLGYSLKPPTYEASSLVVMSDIRTSPDVLARYGTQVFNGGQVTREVTADPRIGGNPQEIVPDRLELVAAQDSVAYEVVGKDSDPDMARHISRVASRSFLTQLQRADGPGPGVATFSLGQFPDEPTAEPVEETPTAVLALLGSLGGFVLGLGVLLLGLVLRRPTIGTRDVSDAVGAPLLGVVTLPRSSPSEFPSIESVSGVADVVRGLLDSGYHVVRIVSPPSLEDDPRQKVTTTVAVALGQRYRVHVEGQAALKDAVRVLARASTQPAQLDGEQETPDFVIVDEPGGLDLRWVGESYTLLVVPEGLSASRLRRAVSESVVDGASGVVLYRIVKKRRGDTFRTVRGETTGHPQHAASATVPSSPTGTQSDVYADVRGAPRDGDSRY